MFDFCLDTAAHESSQAHYGLLPLQRRHRLCFQMPVHNRPLQGTQDLQKYIDTLEQMYLQVVEQGKKYEGIPKVRITTANDKWKRWIRGLARYADAQARILTSGSDTKERGRH